MRQGAGRLAVLRATIRTLADRGLGGSINIHGELFGTALTFLAGAVLRLGSSLVLTRWLYPEAYGIVAILASVLFVLEMLSDIGVTGLLIRHERGDQPDFIDTLWTARLLRGVLNFGLAFALAPWIATFYGEPRIGDALRILSPWFLFAALESAAIPLAMRHQKARLVGYLELACSAASTLFVIVFSYYSRDHWGMVYGMVFGRALQTAASYVVFRRGGPRLFLERPALRELFNFSKYVMPTSVLTMLLVQYDKVIFLRLFDLGLLGIYGVAGSIAMPVSGLLTRVHHVVLFPRCAETFRRDPTALREGFYLQNVRLVALATTLPALVGGAAQQIIELLFDPRYSAAGFVLGALMLKVSLQAILEPAETVLTAVGYPRAQMMSNFIRIGWLVPASLFGYYWMGFHGFVLMAALDALPALAYTLWVQRRKKLLVVRFEVLRVAFALACWLISYSIASTLGSTTWWQVHFA